MALGARILLMRQGWTFVKGALTKGFTLVTVLSLQFWLQGCVSISGTTLSIFLEETDLDPLSGTLNFESGGYLRNIATASPTTFEFTGYCPNPGDTLTIGGASAFVTTCNSDQRWSSIQDISGIGDGTYALTLDDSSGSPQATENLVVDTTAPSYFSVTSPTTPATYGLGADIYVDIRFDESIVVSGTSALRLAMSTGNDAVFDSQPSGDTIRFVYVVQSGDSVTPIDWTGAGALSVGSGTIRDFSGNDALLPVVASAGLTGINANGAATPAAITSVAVVGGSADYVAGTVTIQLNFAENIMVSGIPQLQLETGVTDRYAVYVSGSGGSTLNFDYTIVVGDVNYDLDFLSAAALDLNGGAMVNVSAIAIDLTLPTPGGAGSISNLYDVKVDAESPTFASISASPSTGNLNSGTVNIDITFSESLVLNMGGGFVDLALSSGGSASCTGVTGSTLNCIYTIMPGHNTTDLDYTSSSALTIGGGATLEDALGNIVGASALPFGATGDLAGGNSIAIDTTPPQIVSIDSPEVGAVFFGVGQTFDIDVNFNEPVTYIPGSGRLRLQLEGGATDYYTSSAVVFDLDTIRLTYTVQAGNDNADVAYTSLAAALELFSGATIRDAAGNNADLASRPAPGAANSLSSNENILIDGVSPTIVSVSFVGAVPTTYVAGQTVGIRVQFSEDIAIAGAPTQHRILLNVSGGATRYASYARTFGTDTLEYDYVVQPDDATGALDYVTAASDLSIVGGSIDDLRANTASTTLLAVGDLAGDAVVIDGTVPSITALSITEINNTYGIGQVLTFTVSFDESVTVATATDLAINLSNGASAAIAGGLPQTNTSFAFSYTILEGESSADLDITSLSYGTGSVQDAAGNGADLVTLPYSIAATRAIVIDAERPSVIGILVDDADLNALDNLDVTVHFDEPVLIAGLPSFPATGYTLTYVDTGTLPGNNNRVDIVFRYDVNLGDNTTGVTNDSPANITGGTITDVNGNPSLLANLFLSPANTAPTVSHPTSPGWWWDTSPGSTAVINLDTTAPGIFSVTSPQYTNTYPVAQFFRDPSTIDIYVTFDEPVVVEATQDAGIDISLNGTTLLSGGTYNGVQNRLEFTRTLLPGDSSGGGASLDVTSFTVTAGEIRDLADNDLDTTIPALNDMLDNTAIRVEEPPMIVTIDFNNAPAVGSWFGSGQQMLIDVTFDQSVIADWSGGVPTVRLALDSGNIEVPYNISPHGVSTDYTGTTHQFVYTVGPTDYTNALGVTYAVQSGSFTLNSATFVSSISGFETDYVFMDVPGGAGDTMAAENYGVDGVAPSALSFVKAGVSSSAPTVWTGGRAFNLNSISATETGGSGLYQIRVHKDSNDCGTTATTYATAGIALGWTPYTTTASVDFTLPGSPNPAEEGLRDISLEVTDNAGNAACVSDSIYVYPPLDVLANYSVGMNWMQYVSINPAEPFYDQSVPTACGVGDTNFNDCMNGGELKEVHLYGNMCTDVSSVSVSPVDAFNWDCDDGIGHAVLYSSKLDDAFRLQDLIDTSLALSGADNWIPLQIDVNLNAGAGSATRSSLLTRWWTNDIQDLSAIVGPGTTDIGGAIYVVRDGTGIALTGGINITAGQTAIVVPDGVALGWNSGSGANCALDGGLGVAFRCLIRMNNGAPTFGGWLEGRFVGTALETDRLIVLYRAHHFEIRGAKIATAQRAGVRLDNSTAVRIKKTRVADININSGASPVEGILFENTVGSSLFQVNVNNIRSGGIGPVGGIMMLSGSSDNSVQSVSVLGVSGSGIRLSGSDQNKISGYTAVNVVNGITIFTSNNNTLNSILTINTSSNGLNLQSADGQTISNVFASNTDGFGISATGGSSYNNEFLGKLKAFNCNDVGTVGIDGDCSAGSEGGNISDFYLETGMNASTVFIGEADTDSGVNAHSAGAPLSATTITDWFNFSSEFHEGWIYNTAGTSLTIAGRGIVCTTSCSFFDLTLSSGPGFANSARLTSYGGSFMPEFVDATACPASLDAGNIQTSIGSSFSSGEQYLFNAMEVPFDQLGDDDGLCEVDEDCLYAPNFGAYQGTGDIYLTECTMPAGAFSGNAMYRFPTN